ncbi:DMT family transporter [Caulobacter segnis]|uniref:DMT family transporter n=1 Tax=Caulobacter segnis TaxID=88688 RepID=UPI0024101A02|nr:DMT family transporter [Caulobacter segnis]MDG2522297.1 DMT family transporter [Caulobacter segnis]
MLWIPVTIGAATLQVARNAAQRSVMTGAGPWGATLVRFLFGLPFALLFVGILWLATPGARFHPSAAFFLACLAGAGLQMAATASMLTAMQRSSFALGTAMQQSGLPFALVWGVLFFGDHVGPLVWLGGGIATLGLTALSWPRGGAVHMQRGAVLFGLGSGAMFALSANFFRQGALALDPNHLVLSAFATVAVVQAIQTVSLGGWLLATNRTAVIAVVAAWRRSLGAGFCGAAASGLWFTAMALSPVGPVRAVGVIEMPIAALVGRRLFAERLSLLQWAAGGLTAAGVVLAATG